MKFGNLKEITGVEMQRWYTSLMKSQDGCCSLCFNADDKYNYAVCMGWHNLGDGPVEKNYNHWVIAWKIGRQTHNNIMQCDFDVDFEMPYNEDGDVDDTCETIVPEDFVRTGDSWGGLAQRICREAARIWDTWKEVSDE